MSSSEWLSYFANLVSELRHFMYVTATFILQLTLIHLAL